jgi:hypothetical protein
MRSAELHARRDARRLGFTLVVLGSLISWGAIVWAATSVV